MITYGDQISVEDYNTLRTIVGWNSIKPERATRGLANSRRIVAYEDGKVIGLARIISDGGYVTAIYDVIVHPEYQRQGIGTQLMKKVMDSVMEDLEEGENQMICLFAAKGKEPFYQNFGFEERPNDKTGAEMTQWVKKKSDHNIG